MSGGLAVSVAQLDLPLNAPDKTRFRASATPRHIAVDAPRYGPRVQLDGGAIAVSEQSVSAKGVKATALDAVLTLSARRQLPPRHDHVRVGASGNVGVEALKWIYARDISEESASGSAYGIGFQCGVEKERRRGRARQRQRGRRPRHRIRRAQPPKRLEVEKVTVHDDART